MKKTVSVLLVLLCLLSVGAVGASAAEAKPIHVSDLLKYDADGSTHVCRTIEIFFENQYRTYDSSKKITFQKADGTVIAECRPYADNNRKFDLYTPGDSFGVVMTPSVLYYLIIPEGAYSADDGTCNAAYRGEYNGIYLSDAGGVYTTADAGIGNFLSGKTADNVLYGGKLIVGSSFTTLINGKNCVLLYLTDGDKKTLVATGSITDYKAGLAEIAFDGVKIDRYASYNLHLQYGTLGHDKVVNAHSDFTLSGKKLLGLSETYPVVNFLVAAFGVNHWTLKVYTGILDALVLLKLADNAMVNDVKNYISARKK